MSATRESQCASPTAEEDDEILRLSNLLIMASASLSALEEARRERQEATQASTIPAVKTKKKPKEKKPPETTEKARPVKVPRQTAEKYGASEF